MRPEERERLRERRKKLEACGVLPRKPGPPSFEPGKTLTFEFESEAAASHFKTWLCEQGEQDYWVWMELRETEEDGPITGLRFDYHQKDKVPVSCGRLDSDD